MRCIHEGIMRIPTGRSARPDEPEGAFAQAAAAGAWPTRRRIWSTACGDLLTGRELVLKAGPVLPLMVPDG
jgi:hypothetical protein